MRCNDVGRLEVYSRCAINGIMITSRTPSGVSRQSLFPFLASSATHFRNPKHTIAQNIMSDLSVNRRAHFDYEILETYEAGIALSGFEVKAVKIGRMALTGAFAVIRGEEAWLLNAAIPPYQAKNTPAGYDPERSRRLLLHKSQIKELIGAVSQKGLTIVPLKVYSKRGRVKVLIGLARHRKQRDKRETIRKRESEREIERTLKRG